MLSVGILVLFRIPAYGYTPQGADAILATTLDQSRHHSKNLQMPISERHLRQRPIIIPPNKRELESVLPDAFQSNSRKSVKRLSVRIASKQRE
ncbi:hypothetical protein X767_28870 [Mesorhizobium sp. LSJC264A00]|nr:hypothetical protein X767_28870 [Mesorhizobium sp. LSJC264A00]